jgi:phosphoadenosine phosphosulfate reductase
MITSPAAARNCAMLSPPCSAEKMIRRIPTSGSFIPRRSGPRPRKSKSATPSLLYSGSGYEYNDFFETSPSENEMMEMAMKEPLETKIYKAVELLKLFETSALDLSQDGYCLCNSGGKDSGVIYHLTKIAKVKFTNNYNVTTLDPPELIRFIKRQYPDMVYHRQKKHLLTRMVEKAQPPTRTRRWCCFEYKEQGGQDAFKVIGVRAEESLRRKGLWKTLTLNRRGNGKFLCPILYWSERDVWDYHRKYNIPYCKLYDEGKKRLGCIGCPLSGAKGIKADFKTWPRYEMLWKRAFKRLWQKWHGIPNKYGKSRFFEKFGSWEKLYEWWLEGVAFDEGEICQGEFMFGRDRDDEIDSEEDGE